MGDDEEGVPYAWASLDTLNEDGTPMQAAYVKTHGRAKVTYPNGDTYEGGFNEAKQKHGRGVYIWSCAVGANAWVPEEGFPEGAAPIVRYDGQYLDGKKHGIGKLLMPDGDKYHGQWEHDKFHGEGTYYYKNGDIYSGNWQRGVRHGDGTLLFKADESQLIGRWERGSFVSGKWVMKDGTSWHGPFKDGKPLGRGVFYFPNGTMQEGEYVQEGDVEDPDAEIVWTWRASSAAKASGVDHRELLRAPITA